MAIQIITIGVAAGGTADSMVAGSIGAIGIGRRVNPDFQIVHHAGDAGIGAVGSQDRVYQPQAEIYGGVVAAPVFKRISSQALSYLGVPREDNFGKRTSLVVAR